MKQYNKTYENVFSTDRPGSTTKLNLEQVSVEEMTLGVYNPLFHKFLKDFYLSLFNNSVRLSWLRRRFSYYGTKTIFPINKNSQTLNGAFVKYLRRVIGMDIQAITRSKFFNKLEGYFEELFPGFNEGNPFENPDYYKYPFKFVSIDYLMAVYQLDDRIELLKKADKEKMSYAVFLDYIINHVYCINEEIGRDRYQIRQNFDRNFPFCIRDTDKSLKIKRKKRT
jgi:hypothetical protein